MATWKQRLEGLSLLAEKHWPPSESIGSAQDRIERLCDGRARDSMSEVDAHEGEETLEQIITTNADKPVGHHVAVLNKHIEDFMETNKPIIVAEIKSRLQGNNESKRKRTQNAEQKTDNGDDAEAFSAGAAAQEPRAKKSRQAVAPNKKPARAIGASGSEHVAQLRSWVDCRSVGSSAIGLTRFALV